MGEEEDAENGVNRTTVVFFWAGEDAEWWVSRTTVAFVGEGEHAEYCVSRTFNCCICGGRERTL